MFNRFERLVRPTDPVPDVTPPARFFAFVLHHLRPVRGLVIALFAGGFAIAVMDTLIPVFIGWLVSIASAANPTTALWNHATTLALAAGIILLLRPATILLYIMTINQAVNPGLANLVRWRSHWHVVRQGWSFFQDDFAGRIANRVMQSGPALREVVVSVADAAWYILVFGISALTILAGTNLVLALPVAAWFLAYGVVLRGFVPRLRDRSLAVSEARSRLTGRMVDSYSNILTVKLFARADDEDHFVRAAMDAHTDAMQALNRMLTCMTGTLVIMNALLLAATAATSLALWAAGRVGVEAVGTALPLAWQCTSLAGWVARTVATVFENIGIVQDAMGSLSAPRRQADRPGATALQVRSGAVSFRGVRFGYGSARGVLAGIDLDIRPGERVGIVGPSGAGKSTLVSLLLGLHSPEAGSIRIDGQDIAGATGESLRACIGVVSQDTALLHRSVRDNIRFGRPAASQCDIEEAARQAQAHDFILRLEDVQGRHGYDVQVGERGVKLSGGQRQRIAIARVLLKGAPILVLDEATSALDSEVEAAIQQQLEGLMQGRTCIAIAHRLSTLSRMDRLVVLEAGRVVEQGSHAALLASGGTYARLWARQSGGFIGEALEVGIG
jgi:ATP-binding cassette subfamily B multidrug efflux pump